MYARRVCVSIACSLVICCGLCACEWIPVGASEIEPGQNVLYIQAHGDDIIQMSAKLYDDLHDENQTSSNFYLLFTANARSEAMVELLSGHLYLPPENICFSEIHQPILRKYAELDELVATLRRIAPHKVFVQSWCGSHPQHDMTQALVMRALELARLRPLVYEYPMQSGLYCDEFYAHPCLETMDRFWNTLVDLENVDEQPTIEVDESDAALDAKYDLIVDWDIDWMARIMSYYTEEEIRDGYLRHERYRRVLPGSYVYTARPYSDPTVPELRDLYPYVCQDLQNYAQCLYEHYGADLWVNPRAVNGDERRPLVEGCRYVFKIALFNKADEADTFSLEAGWGADRQPAPQVTFDAQTVELAPRETRLEACAFTLDTTDLLGDLTLWIKATSAKAAADPNSLTAHVECPVMLHVSHGGHGGE